MIEWPSERSNYLLCESRNVDVGLLIFINVSVIEYVAVQDELSEY